jgi:deaminated glutathione amidase
MKTTVAAIQLCSGTDVAVNLATAARLLAQAAEGGARLAVLPENFALMAVNEADKLSCAEADGRGSIQAFLSAQAAALKMWVVGGTAPLAVPGSSGKIFASCLVFAPDGTRRARYDKLHLFDVELSGGERYRESATFSPGTAPAPPVETDSGRLGLSICYDLRFPELYRELSQQGAELLTVPSAFTRRTGEAHWEVLLRARAIENQCFVIAPNQGGVHAGGRATFGHSMIVDPWGAVLACRPEGEGVVLAELDRAQQTQIRRTFPCLDHRRL